MGYTDFNISDVKHLVDVVGRDFKGDKYHLITKNCNHFTASFAKVNNTVNENTSELDALKGSKKMFKLCRLLKGKRGGMETPS